jgi:uncharacterized protein involved in exopolysaccharide biosynthesis
MKNTDNHSKADIDMNYLELLSLILRRKRVILYFALLGLVIGLLIAYTTPKEYQTTIVTISESEVSGQNLGQMGALAGLAGINMPQIGPQSAITPEMYPEIVGSKDFLHKLMKEKFYFQTKGREMTLEEYYVEERPANVVQKSLNYIMGLPYYLTQLLQNNSEPEEAIVVPYPSETLSDPDQPKYITISSQEIYALNQLKKRINIDVSKKVITIRVSMPEALIAAQVNVMVMEELINFVTDYWKLKQTTNFSFVTESLVEAEAKFKEAQNNLAAFRDLNQGIISQRARVKEEQLQSEYNIAFNVFNTLRQELEQSNIQLKRQRPVFTTLEKASVPLGNSIPNKPLIIIVCLFLGMIFGLIILVMSIMYKSLKSVS